MQHYQRIEFNESVYNPIYANVAANKKTLLIASADLSITREGDTVVLECMKSGRIVETSWSNVRYAFRKEAVKAPIKAPKVAA